VRRWLFIAGLNGALAVLAGAFGAHALGDRPYASAFTTGAHYHLIHAVAMAVAALAARGPAKTLAQSAALLFFVGTVLFSGSLYALTLTGVRIIGVVTPLGGLALIAGWVLLALAALKLEEPR
jgi:uncharacterized membrane protein YgdD (TMEM256/DUF423 family)